MDFDLYSAVLRSTEDIIELFAYMNKVLLDFGHELSKMNKKENNHETES